MLSHALNKVTHKEKDFYIDDIKLDKYIHSSEA